MAALAVVFINLLFAQGMMSGFARAAMAGTMLARGAVICTVTGPLALVPEPDDDGSDKSGHPDCPCGTLCRLAALVLPAILGAVAFLLLLAPRPRPPAPRALRAIPPPRRRGLTGAPRAPPLFS